MLFLFICFVSCFIVIGLFLCVYLFRKNKREEKELQLLYYIYNQPIDDGDEFTTFCFDCDYEFRKSKDEPITKFCPYCGKKTHGFDDESFKRFYNDEEND